MPYILDKKATQDIENWMLTAKPKPSPDLSYISFPLEAIPGSLYTACKYAVITGVSIVNQGTDPERSFVEVITDAPDYEREIGANIWLAPMVSPITIRKILERLAI